MTGAHVLTSHPVKILRTSPNVQDEAELCSELVRSWSALEGAPDTVIASLHDGERLVKTRTSALDLAIVSGSKKFLSQPLVQHLITLIYDGDLIYSPVSSHALIADSLSNPAPKRRRRGATSTEEHEEEDSQPVEVYAYNPYKAGWLDYQRLRVPRWRRWIEFLSLTILITLFLLTLSSEPDPVALMLTLQPAVSATLSTSPTSRSSSSRTRSALSSTSSPLPRSTVSPCISRPCGTRST